jgi:hypothetical protein
VVPSMLSVANWEQHAKMIVTPIMLIHILEYGRHVIGQRPIMAVTPTIHAMSPNDMAALRAPSSWWTEKLM